MKTAGIICEYNPFHLGHLRQIQITREILGEDCAIVCVMSGNYVQRGMPAMWDKFIRAQAALCCGADLVLELPITGVLQSAEGFAATGVEILHRLGCVDYLSFGAESGSAETYLKLARDMESEQFKAALRENLDAGLSYAAARQHAAEGAEVLLQTPNNILALEYCRAIVRLKSHLKPVVIIRNGDYHDSIPQPGAPSATAVRNIYPDGDWQAYVPENSARVLSPAPWYDITFGERAILARLRALDDKQWECCAHGSEGLWSKAMKAARSQPDLEGIIGATKSKRYPRTRIQRLLLCAFLGISDHDLKQPVPYVRILSANKTGRHLLRLAKDYDKLLLINPGQTPPIPEYYAMECRASRLFSLFSAPGHHPNAQLEETGRVFLK